MIYKLKYRKGIDDLKSLYAFHGNSQGDTSQTNDIQVFLASKGWMSFVFNCEMTEEAISRQIAENDAWNIKYIESLKAEGIFGQEDEYSIILEYNPMFDSPTAIGIQKHSLTSHKMCFMDFTDSLEQQPSAE